MVSERTQVALKSPKILGGGGGACPQPRACAPFQTTNTFLYPWLPLAPNMLFLDESRATTYRQRLIEPMKWAREHVTTCT